MSQATETEQKVIMLNADDFFEIITDSIDVTAVIRKHLEKKYRSNFICTLDREKKVFNCSRIGENDVLQTSTSSLLDWADEQNLWSQKSGSRVRNMICYLDILKVKDLLEFRFNDYMKIRNYSIVSHKNLLKALTMLGVEDILSYPIAVGYTQHSSYLTLKDFMD